MTTDEGTLLVGFLTAGLLVGFVTGFISDLVTFIAGRR